MTWDAAGWFIIAQIPLLIVIVWLLNQLTKTNTHLKDYADRYGQLAGHDVVASREYVRAASERAAAAEPRVDDIRTRRANRHPLAATVEEEEGTFGP